MTGAPMKQKILLVDDEPSNLRLLHSILKKEHALMVARDGREALRLAAMGPDLILLDIMMPGMDGYEVCRCLKADDETRDIPVIFVTAKREEADEALGFEAGSVDYITKPISPLVVEARVKTHLSLRMARRHLEERNVALEKAQAELKKQHQALLEADQLKKDVERITRHDLKSPLNGIILYANMLLKQGGLATAHRDRIAKIRGLGHQVMDMVNLSLGLFKMEQGSYVLDAKRVDLLPILHNIISEYEQIRRLRELDLEVMLDGEPVAEGAGFFVQGEELLCYSMLANLVKNALEASPEGFPVTISLNSPAAGSAGPGQVTIHNFSVVPEAVRERFFEKYVTCGKQSGTGLGTYSAKLIAVTQKGDIRMETSEEEGTTVTIELPVQ